MTRNRIGFLVALLGVGLVVACGSSPIDAAIDADTSSSATGGVTATGGTSATEDSVRRVPMGGTTGAGGTVASGGTTSPTTGTYERIASGTVKLEKWVGATTTSCQQVLRLTNPAQSLSGFIQMGPALFRNDPRAGEPSYVYLDGGKDAVILTGPSVTYGSPSVDVSAAQLTTRLGGGYSVQVNDRLTYVVGIEDWEDEVALGTVELCLNNGTLTTQFVFAGLGVYLGGGVAHNLTIVAKLDGISGAPTAGVTIECR